MKTRLLPRLRWRHLVLVLAIFCGNFTAHTQIVFTSGTATCNTSGICLGSGCTNPNNVSDGNTNSFGTVNTVIGVGCTVTLVANFSSLQSAGNWFGFEVQGAALATLLTNVTLRAVNTGTSQTQQASGSGILQLIGTNQGFIQIQSTIAFDQIQLDLVSVVGVAQSLDVFFGYSNPAKLLFALPVSLARFDVVQQDKDALLLWRTESEQNSNRFEIEQSINGISFIKIAEVAAAGNSSSEINYNYTDHNIGHYGSIEVYYRLRLVDNDGNADFSPIRLLGAPRTEHVHVYPMPFHDVIAVDLPVDMSGPAEINLTDMQGRLIYHRRDNVTNSQAGLILSGLSALPGGMYVLTIRTSNEVKNLKVIKQ